VVDTEGVRALDPQTTILFAAVGWLMVYAGLGKKQLRLRLHKTCPHCGLRHAPGNCTSLRH
jgi:hypothetical protein